MIATRHVRVFPECESAPAPWPRLRPGAPKGGHPGPMRGRRQRPLIRKLLSALPTRSGPSAIVEADRPRPRPIHASRGGEVPRCAGPCPLQPNIERNQQRQQRTGQARGRAFRQAMKRPGAATTKASAASIHSRWPGKTRSGGNQESRSQVKPSRTKAVASALPLAAAGRFHHDIDGP